jgi:hypothetical protein
MTTKPMLIICSWCKSKTPMNTNKMWWNFEDPKWADPIGYCSEECIKYAQVQKELIREKAGL